MVKNFQPDDYLQVRARQDHGAAHEAAGPGGAGGGGGGPGGPDGTAQEEEGF